MEELTLVEQLSGFANGNTLVLLYMVVSLTRLVLVPIYRSGKEIKGFLQAATKALNEGVFSHAEIVVELKALNQILARQDDS